MNYPLRYINFIYFKITKSKQSFFLVSKQLWEQERMNLFVKGLTARLTYSSLYSFFVMLGYETVKRYSLKEEYI
jgi:solute carrier family 25 protein 44